METKTIIKRIIGLLFIMNIFPIIFIFVAITNHDPWYIGYAAGLLLDIVISILMAIGAFISWCFS
jgi:hypothetical protein